MGYNQFGQIGDGTFTRSVGSPEEIISNNVVAIAAGDDNSFFIKSDGSLWAVGSDSFGQFGDGMYQFTNRPEQIVSAGVVAVAAGTGHALFIKSDGSLWAMGHNDIGQLGDGTYNTTNIPEQIVSSGVIAVAAGAFSSVFLKADGSVWTMGDDWEGQLGDGFLDDETAVPEEVYPLPQPILTESISDTTNLQFTAACQFGGTFCLLATSNLTQSVNLWTPVATNIISDRNNNVFSATLTPAAVSGVGQQFYILQSQ